MFQWRAFWPAPYWKQPLDRRIRTRSPSRNSTKATGICQPGIGGASTDLSPKWAPQQGGYLDIHFNSALQRYAMIVNNDTTFYAESVDGLVWTPPIALGNSLTE
jgi:hypothetical protein